ncbi:MAG: TIGR00725 family protein [Acidobacteriota bacterium]
MQMVAVIGSSEPDSRLEALAKAVGSVVARGGYRLVCGGLGGVMEAACRGARSVLGEANGRIVGILPGEDKSRANPYVDIAIPTGIGLARNVLVVMAADAVVAVGGASGTLSEVAHAWQLGRPICALLPGGGWAARLAGRQLDNKCRERIFEATSVAQVESWLQATLD